ncbi:PorP/SprF family type IX secretion system membrane protein [Pedobacter mendelii]|uniref:Membrane protein n=1 Tax=Pedobacter mendelii TaxID=1908240 RepID=A0ABQ2BNR0_9SPHI|nr:type IX secretion system membrane protein PorP/SprF [Pedobacter mendelii]GGI28675.1 membrane protein [Pedobacter mendelii]
MKKPVIRKPLLAVAILLLVKLPSMAQQNIQFSQYIFNSLSVNPAYAGYKEELFAQLALRTQWTGLKGAPQTGQFSLDGVTESTKRNVGLGIQLTADKLGSQTANSLYLNYAYRIRLNADDTQRLSFGLGAGVTNYAIDGASLRPVEQDDPTVTNGKLSSFIPDTRFGIYYSSPKYYVGASVMDMFSGDISNDIFKWDTATQQNIKRKRHYYIMTGFLLNLSEGLKLRPSLLWKEDLKGPSSLDLNAMVIFGDRFWIGGGYRTGVNLWNKEFRQGQTLSNANSISGIIQFYASNRFRIGYSYDYITSGLSSVQNGSHEITIGLTFPTKFNRLLSPRFF